MRGEPQIIGPAYTHRSHHALLGPLVKTSSTCEMSENVRAGEPDPLQVAPHARPRRQEHGRAAFNNDAGCAPRHTHTVSIGKPCISDLISQSLSNPYSEGINLDIAQSTNTNPSIHPPRHNVSKQAQASSDHIPSEKPQALKSSQLGIVMLPWSARRGPHARVPVKCRTMRKASPNIDPLVR